MSVSVSGRGIWGAKRKKGGDEEEVDEVEVSHRGTAKTAGFEASRKRFETAKDSPLSVSKDQITAAINAYIDVMEKMMNAPEFGKKFQVISRVTA